MIKFRMYSKYTSTDALKVSPDSGILDKEEKGGLSSGEKTGLLGAAGAVLGAAGAKKGKLSKLAGGTKGALIGAGIGIGASMLNKANKERKENNFYNRRLREAKRAAARRESVDWQNRIHGRQMYE